MITPRVREGEPAILHGHVASASFPDCHFLECFNWNHEMLLRRVAMSSHALRVGAVVRGAEICGGDGHRRAGDAPPPVKVGVLLAAPELEAGAADLAAPEESLAESGGGHAITAVKEVAVSARAADRVGGGVVSCLGG